MNSSVAGAIQRNLLRGGSSTARQSSHGILYRPQHHLHLQVRHLPYVPLAYQRGASKAMKQSQSARPRGRSSPGSSSKRGRTPPIRRSRRGAPAKGAADGTSSSGKYDPTTTRQRGSLEYALQGQKDALLRRQKELEQSLLRYRESLGNALQSTTADTEEEAEVDEKAEREADEEH